jgi:hypothetical protein
MAPADRSQANINSSEAQGVLFREGIRFQVWNSIITGDFFNGCLDIDDGGTTDGVVVDTFNRVNEAGGSPVAAGPHLSFHNSIIDCKTYNFVANDEKAS